MKEPKSQGKTMAQLKAYKKSAKGTNKAYWQGRIDGLAGRAEYKKYLKSLKK
ncbi:hypothetical protein [Candidatus Pelagibacter communis]|jgi:hypothetical protein|uniref:hypothetical protein n=1 Tax=Pelagibacter ubique TaxID=198252 RepID=UPI0015CF6BE4|nr:hypothetical protein [Candidatus Pelagibacter ubique]|tara:strand:+ start:1103 stop:1258 length:156 start_codon:yes stop_codon:yes gene_type:complete